MLLKASLHVGVFLLLAVNALTQEQRRFYPIRQHELWGFIEARGNEVIAPRFISVGEFSEGLASARLTGYFGFIDTTGKFVIEPQFEKAYSFREGRALVYKDDKRQYIDQKGNNVSGLYTDFGFACKVVEDQNNGLFKVETPNGSQGLVDEGGRIVLDTAYSKIRGFSDGRAVVQAKAHHTYTSDDQGQYSLDVGVVNSRGEWVVPFGVYRDIRDFNDGLAIVVLNKPNMMIAEHIGLHPKGVIDTNARLLFEVPIDRMALSHSNGFQNGVMPVEIFVNPVDTSKPLAKGPIHLDSYIGAIDRTGNFVFSNANWKEIRSIDGNRAFVKDVQRNWFMINSRGQVINDQPFLHILPNRYSRDWFYEGVAVVYTEEGIGVIDTNSKFVLEPRKFDESIRIFERIGPFVTFYRNILDGYETGFWNIESNTLVEPRFQDLHIERHEDELFQVTENDRMGYIDRTGEYVWREDSKPIGTKASLNIHEMMAGYCVAAVPRNESIKSLGGWAGSRNVYQEINAEDQIEDSKLSLVVKPEESTVFKEKYEGIKMYLANTTSDTFFFSAQDSRIDLILQAIDTAGEWKDIEYLPGSFCGNSYHWLFLPPNHFWEFDVPVYEGERKTKLRAKLLYNKSMLEDQTRVTYSNEFEGNLNSAQFWMKD